ncbi:hypothetical protein [Streptomyces diastaticus]
MNASDPAGRDGVPAAGGAEDQAARSLRRALHGAAGPLVPPPYPAARVRRMGRRRVRNRRVAAVVPAAVAAVLMVAAVPQWLGSGTDRSPAAAGPGPSATPGPGGGPTPLPEAARPPRPSGSPWPAVRTAAAGEPVDVGRGHRMTLAGSEVCHRDTGGPGGGVDSCKSVTDGNQPTGTVSLQQFGELVRPLYIGPGRPARMTVETGGVVHRAQLLTLAGDPGYAVGYSWADQPRDPSNEPPPSVKVYDADGEVLAEFP